jgi:hypothetical protein
LVTSLRVPITMTQVSQWFIVVWAWGKLHLIKHYYIDNLINLHAFERVPWWRKEPWICIIIAGHSPSMARGWHQRDVGISVWMEIEQILDKRLRKKQSKKCWWSDDNTI